MRILALLLLAILLNSCAYYFGNNWQRSFHRIPESSYPEFEDHPKPLSADKLKDHPLVIHFADKALERPTKKDQRGPERLILAKMIANKDISEVNEYLLQSIPWGNSGTSGSLNPKGDYDFTTVILAAILNKFENDTSVLWKKTEEHLAKVLLVEEGGKPHKKTPRTLSIMRDTENHILMTNISQYLKNQWIWERDKSDTRFDNLSNGLESFLLNNLEELQQTGQYEFNSKPYEGYTVSALLILYSYTHSKELKAKTQRTLDMMAWEYTETSSDFRKNAPFRRRLARFDRTSLEDNPMTAMMKAWNLEKEKGVFELEEIAENHHQVLSAIVYDYRPPSSIWNVNDSERLVLIGHGHHSSPEIHSRGKVFMLSAGGFQRGQASQIVSRPIVLMLDDRETDHTKCFHILGKGKFPSWNNTGLHHRFAVGKQPVQIPERYKAVDTLGNWKLFEPTTDVIVATYSENDFGLIYLPKEQIELSELKQMNSQVRDGKFTTEDSKVMEFDVNSGKGKWVIKSVNGTPTERKTDKWKRVDVQYAP